MFKNIADIIAKVNTVSGIEITLLPDGKSFFCLSIISYKKGKIHIESQRTELLNDEKIKDCVSTKYPLLISIDGNGVLYKKVKSGKEDTLGLMASTIFPNANALDFYIQTSLAGGNEKWVSLIRRDIADAIINQFNKAGIYTVALFLGPFISGNSCTIIENEQAIHTSLGKKISFRENCVYEITQELIHSEKNIKIDGEDIPEKMLVSFSVALSFFVPLANFVSDVIQKIEEAKKEFMYRTLFKRVGVFFLAFFMLLTFGNLFFFSFFQEKHNAIYSQVTVNNNLLSELDSLTIVLEKNKKFIAGIGILQRGKISFYCDRIAANVPDDITLQSLNVNPIKKTMKEDELPSFNYQQIRIKGTCNHSFIFNDWLKNITGLHWVADVMIINYNQGPTTLAEFEIQVNIKT